MPAASILFPRMADQLNGSQCRNATWVAAASDEASSPMLSQSGDALLFVPGLGVVVAVFA